MNAQAAKRLRIAAVRHYLANNAGKTDANTSLILKRTYKILKKQYKAGMEFPKGGHGLALSKIHDIRERGRVEKFLDPKGRTKINAQEINEIGDIA